MDSHLLSEVLTRLDADAAFAALGEGMQELVLAACLGEVETTLSGKPPERPAVDAGQELRAERAYLRSITVQGFRGIGPEAQLELPPGPGLTLVIGRNGSGKSSFAEGLELLLTGDSRRWSDSRSKIWKAGWRNLHHPSRTAITAELLIDGQRGPARVRREWAASDKLEDGRARLQRKKGPEADADELGWREALVAYRPFLSYNELGSMLAEGPSRLFDALGSILGLEDLVTAADALDAARKQREAEHKTVTAALDPLLRDLATLSDERAATVHGALAGKRWKLELAAEAIASNETPQGGAHLAAIATLAGPDPDMVAATTAELASARAAVHALASSDAERDRRVADLLESSLALHEHEGDGDCPVCGRKRALTAKWRKDTVAAVATLRASAEQAVAAHDRLRAAERAARALASSPPTTLQKASEVGIDTSPLVAAWGALAALASEAQEVLAAQLGTRTAAVLATLAPVRAAAQALRREREESFRPLALRVAAWLDGAHRVEANEAVTKRLKAAAKWLRDTATVMRNERFTPIADQVKRHWEVLRARSSVEIADIRFGGAGSQRRVELDVTIDGSEGAALGVMSQGELHALALCLFLPRATLAQSPFGFLVIDDPVQAMDPSRVDGLARLLAEVAGSRQVVVFTHDDRLPEAVRLQHIAATVIEVRRGEGSTIELGTVTGPSERLIGDALALVQTRELPAEVLRRVVPGICRQGIEAACRDVIRRRRLVRGESHREVETLLQDHGKLLPQLALALYDDAERTADVLKTLNNKFGKYAGDVAQWCNKGAHGAAESIDIAIVRNAEKLTKQLQGLT